MLEKLRSESAPIIPLFDLNVNLPSKSISHTISLVTLIKSKNEKGFQFIYNNYSKALHNIIRKFVVNSHVADDLLQETFVKIWKNIDAFDQNKGALFTWMRSIARNIAIDYVRSGSYKNQLRNISFNSSCCYLEESICFVSEVEVNDFKIKTLLILDQKYAEIIDLIFFYDWTYSQVAAFLNLPLGTVKTRARIAIQILRRHYSLIY